MKELQLNLARKWRSKQFDEIVGQDLAVRVLKNSLYKNYFFPVYLFAGQKGCGKTTTARVFSAAVNCEQLAIFQEQPRSVVLPCLQCTSCQAMMTQSHPDFIEIDAASHTGVDNIRNIIDSSSFLPLLGRKKIYLIDEAHMLSKAAFNAFLKILEEPPRSVLFILATTDTEKIIETVRSRCFQIFFQPIKRELLVDYLQDICTAEDIIVEKDVLYLIAHHAKGSARDALNILEQVRFSSGRITKAMIYDLLGYIDEARLVQLLSFILAYDASRVLQFFKHEQIDNYLAKVIWNGFVELIRAAIWIKHEVFPDAYHQYHQQIVEMIASIPVQRLHAMITLFYHYQEAFSTTTQQCILLEMILLQLCNIDNTGSGSSIPSVSSIPAEYQHLPRVPEHELERAVDKTVDKYESLWRIFVQEVAILQDPLLNSLFTQALYRMFEKDTQCITLEFSKQFQFFQEWIMESRTQWGPIMEKIFQCPITLNLQFVLPERGELPISKESQVEQRSSDEGSTVKYVSYNTKASHFTKKNQKQKQYSAHYDVSKEQIVSAADLSSYPTATLLKKYFPGIVTYAVDLPVDTQERMQQKSNLFVSDDDLIIPVASQEPEVYA